MKGRLVFKEEDGSSKNTKQKKMAAVKDKMQRLKKADFTEKTKVANLGYKNPLKQGVSDIVFSFSEAQYVFNICSHGNKLMWQRHQAILRRSSLLHSVKFQKYQVQVWV